MPNSNFVPEFSSNQIFIDQDVQTCLTDELIKLETTKSNVDHKHYEYAPKEHIHTEYFEPIITGRSSMGRLGIAVHQEAGFGDIGFNGTMTLQLKVTYPTRIYPYFPMAQVYFLTPHGEIKDLYNGKYQNATGIAGSKAYQDFEKLK